MHKRGIIIHILAMLLLASSNATAGQIICKFNPDSLTRSDDNCNFKYPGLSDIYINPHFSLPVKTVYLENRSPLSAADIYVRRENKKMIGNISIDLLKPDRKVTGFQDLSPDIQSLDQAGLSTVVFDWQVVEKADKSYYAVSLLPVTVDEQGGIHFNEEICIETDAPDILVSRSEIYKAENVMVDNGVSFSANKALTNQAFPLGHEFVIVTTGELAEAFQELADFKNAIGISTAVAIIDSIYQVYEGLDNAVKLRAYLIDFYQSGGQYVLLGGDNILLPVRYVYYYNAGSPPSSPYYLMPSDLYFADLSGDWDADEDGIWGEPTDDDPDLSPELIVGRLPLRTSEAAQNYVSKLIKYATEPGDGDFEYLNKSLFFSSDEMRDYPTGGQHRVIAGELPDYYHIDTVFGVEFPSGDDPDPTNPLGYQCIEKISEGFGFIHIIAHGRIDGFLVRSANYGDWPASLIITGPPAGYHGSIDNIESNQKTSLYYSLSCNVGGYDLDSADGDASDWSLVERLIAKESSGAVGMVAYSRWGWVYSSYYLQQAFTANLYGSAEGNPARAMYNSWIDYPYYRDLIYGQNYFGDPTQKIYTDIPKRIEATIPKSLDGHHIHLSSKGVPVAGAIVSVETNGEILESGLTDENGNYTIDCDLIAEEEYIITAAKDGYTVFRNSYFLGLTLDVENDDNMLPVEFALDQNYPNPFNPMTNIKYTLPHRADVTFEIFNILGQIVYASEIIDQAAGQHTITWDGTDSDNRETASGIYFYRLSAGECRQTRKMVLLR